MNNIKFNFARIISFQIGLLFIFLFVITSILIDLFQLSHSSPYQYRKFIVSTNSTYPQIHQLKPNNNTNMISNVNEESVTIDRKLFDYLAAQLEETQYSGVEIFTQYAMALNSGRKPLVGHDALRPEFGPVINDVTYYQYPIQIPSCKKSETGHSVIVFVISAPSHFDQREAIRQTWLRHLKNPPKERYSDVPLDLIGFAFSIGLTNDEAIQKQIEEENKKYSDILQIGMIDTYYNLTVKVAGLMNWVHKNCKDVDFVLKTDDDVYVNVNNFAAAIQTANRTDLVLFGTVSNNRVQRGMY